VWNNDWPSLVSHTTPTFAADVVGAIPGRAEDIRAYTRKTMGLPDIEEDPPVPSDDETLTGHTDSRRDDIINVRDWSQTGRGSHVDFEYKDIVPLEQGK
jgi:hypothetical protein